MIAIDNTLISDDLIESKFSCRLDICHGACCIQGDAGAPLNAEEIDIIEGLLPDIKPFMIPEHYNSVLENGIAEKDRDGEWVTTCQPSGACNFVVFNGLQTECAIELAYKAGAIAYKKPISCHLYPVRVKEYNTFTAVNYHKWDICKPACTSDTPLYIFLKEALIRKFGQEWYDQLQAYADYANSKQ